MSARVQGAVIREQGVEFAIVIVKRHVIENDHDANEAIASYQPIFGVPTILMAQDFRGTPTYYGREDIARFMADVPLEAVPWAEYSID